VANDEEMAAAFEYYIEQYCGQLTLERDVPLPPSAEATPVDLTEDSGDIGVDRFRGWSTSQVWASLGLPAATQFPFGEPGTVQEHSLDAAARRKIIPRWHQVTGVHAILDGAFTKQLGEGARPALLCDDVGLGKTLQIIGVVSVLAHMCEQQGLPPLERLAPPPFTIGQSKRRYQRFIV
jgi:hypothetical protein